jgi:hypothetical protein
MTRPMTALCAVATAFVCLAPAAFARETKQLPAPHAAPSRPAHLVSPVKGAARAEHAAARHAAAVRAVTAKLPDLHAGPHDGAASRHEEPAAPTARVASPRSDAKSSGVGSPPRARPEHSEGKAVPAKTAGRSDDGDPVIRFEAPEAESSIGVTPRSKTIAVLEDWREDARRAHKGKHAHGRPVRPVPPNASWLKYRREPWRRGYVSVFGHGKHWSGYLVGPNGSVLPLARQSLSAALSSWRTGKQMLIDERLMALVADVSDEFGGRPIRIVSGYREHSYAPDSKHKVGQAFDFSVPGVPNEALRDFLRSLGDVGVGYYPNSTHVHLDVREKPCYWVDYSRPGEHPLYAWDRRVAGLTPAERALASALEEIATRPGLEGATASSAHDPAAAEPGEAPRRVAAPSSYAQRAAPLGAEPSASHRARSAEIAARDSSDDENEPTFPDAGAPATVLPVPTLPDLPGDDDRGSPAALPRR